MGGRSMPVECPHGNIVDWGDFGDSDADFGGAEDCAQCQAEYQENKAKNARHVIKNWVRECPAEAVALLIEAGALEQVGWRYESATRGKAYGFLDYHPAEAGHADHERVYRLVEHPKGAET